MAAPLYVTSAEFKSSLSISGTELDADIDRALGAASRGVEKLTERRPGAFQLDAGATTRTYTASSSCFVVIDELGQLDEVTSNGTVVTVTPEPLNATDDDEPFTMLASNGKFSTKRAAISVTGRFGWPVTPDQVPQFVQIVASKLLKRVREAPFGLVSGAFDGEVVRIAREDPDAMFLVEELKRHRVAVG